MGYDLMPIFKGAFGVSGFVDRKEQILSLQSCDGKNAERA
jgi:hypothetical protein